jgi:hypothetical protein
MLRGSDFGALNDAARYNLRFVPVTCNDTQGQAITDDLVPIPHTTLVLRSHTGIWMHCKFMDSYMN